MQYPGNLTDAARQTTRSALARGALQPIPTQWHFIDVDGARFVMRMLEPGAARTPQWWRPSAARWFADNPFWPYEADLFVADLSSTHVCILNKFAVLEGHLLVLTRSVQAQQTVLGYDDFEALWQCLLQIDGLGFYNSGATAGASQPHRHLQVVPADFGGPEGVLPIETLLRRAPLAAVDGFQRLAAFDFLHRMAPIEAAWLRDAHTAARRTHALYLAMIEALGLRATTDRGPEDLLEPYNLLVTRRFMMIVPRRARRAGTIAVNALGYAGSLFIRNESEVALLRERGPLGILADVGWGEPDDATQL